MITALNALGQYWWAWVGPMLWQASLLAIVALAVDVALRRRGWPQLRYALWLLVLVRLVVPPTFALPTSLVARALPSPRLVAPATLLDAPLPEPSRSAPSTAASSPPEPAAAGRPEDAGRYFPDAAARPPAARLSKSASGMLLAAAVTLLLATWLFVRQLRLQRLIAEAAKAAAPPAPLHDALVDVAAQLGLRRPPRVVMTDRIGAAAVCGVLHPCVILPDALARQVTAAQLRHILLHEVAHIKRCDMWVNALQTMLLVLSWFHPAVWLAGRRLRHLRELCCDATVARILQDDTRAYRETLVAVARAAFFGRAEPGLGLLGLYENASRIRARLEQLELPLWRRARRRGLLTALAIAVAALCILPMAPVKGASRPSDVPAANHADPAGRIAGRVVDAATGLPLTQFTVRLAGRMPGEDLPGVPIQLMVDGVSFSDTNGRFDLGAQDTNRNYRLIVTAAGYALSEISDVHAGVPAGVKLTKSTPVTVTVTDAETGKAIDNADVRFSLNGAGNFSYSSPGSRPPPPSRGRSEPSRRSSTLPPLAPVEQGGGRYLFDQVGAGDWQLLVEAPGYAPRTVAIKDPATKPTTAIQLGRGVVVSGLLTPPPGMTPSQFDLRVHSLPLWLDVPLGGDGRFRREAIPPGWASISVRERATGSSFTRMVRFGAPEAGKVDVDLTQFVLLEGAVTRKGTPVSEATVQAQGPAAGGFFSASHQVTDGRYRLWLPQAGKYRIDCQSYLGNESVTLDLQPGRQTQDLALTGAAIFGKVVDERGQPLLQGYVTLLTCDTSDAAGAPQAMRDTGRWRAVRQGQLNEAGEFVLPQLRAGDWWIVAMTADRERLALSDRISVTAAADVSNVVLAMTGLGSLEAEIVDAETDKGIDAAETLFRGGWISRVVARTRGPSPLATARVSAGRYDLFISAQGYVSEIVGNVEIKPSMRVKQTVRLRPAGSLHLTLRTITPKEQRHDPRIELAIKDVPEGQVAFIEGPNSRKPNVASNLLSASEAKLSAQFEGIAQGEHAATLSYWPDGAKRDEKRVKDVVFRIEKGKTTELVLDEAEFKSAANDGTAGQR